MCKIAIINLNLWTVVIYNIIVVVVEHESRNQTTK